MSDVTDVHDPSQPDTSDQPDKGQEQPPPGVVAERKRREAVEAELKQLRQQNAERERAEAERSGEFERLYRETVTERDSLLTLRDEVASYRQREAEARDRRWLALPEALRAVRLDGVTSEQDERILAAQEAVHKGLTSVRAGDGHARSPVGGGGDPSALTEDERQWAEKQRWIDVTLTSAETIRKAYRKAHPA